VTGWHRHRYRSGLTLPADTTARGGDFYLATSEDLYLATSGDFFMATDKVSRRRSFTVSRSFAVLVLEYARRTERPGQM
jgi:hypothetical protein